ncbi:hypothetical protein QQ045_010141 [Rhodiola kirilowii]
MASCTALRIVRRLLRQPKTDTKVVNRCGETAIDTAEKTKHPEVGVILASHGVQSAKMLKPQATNPARELKQTTSVVVIEGKAKKQMMAYINKLMWLACVMVSVAFLALSFIVVGEDEMWLAIGVTIIGC